MSREEKVSIYKAIKKQCLQEPIYIDTTRKPFIDDELEFKLIKEDNETSYELNVYNIDTYKSVHIGKYYKQELMDSMLKVFTEETKDISDIRVYLYYDPIKARFTLEDR
jgi:hypothetical protein